MDSVYIDDDVMRDINYHAWRFAQSHRVWMWYHGIEIGDLINEAVVRVLTYRDRWSEDGGASFRMYMRDHVTGSFMDFYRTYYPRTTTGDYLNVRTVSIDAIDDKEDNKLYTLPGFPRYHPNVIERMILDEDNQGLRKSLDCLTERERLILRLYYVDGMVMEEISDVLGLSDNRISIIHAQAIRKLRYEVLHGSNGKTNGASRPRVYM